MSKPYVKSVDDEIDWKVIDQLHAATSSFSSTSLEIKKLFFVMIGIAIPSLIKLAGDKLDFSLFVSVYVLSITFWCLDSYTYFYQEKLREKMNVAFLRIRERNTDKIILSDTSTEIKTEFTLEASRNANSRVCRSIFNTSILIYVFIIVINTLGLIWFFCKKLL